MTQIISLDAIRQKRAALLADIRGDEPEATVPIVQASADPVPLALTQDGKFFDYNVIVTHAMQGMVRSLFAEIAVNGLPSGSVIYLEFATIAPGVQMPPHLLDAFPREMTLLFDQWWKDLFVSAEGITVTMSFYGQAETLVIPFGAMRAFADPHAGFAVSLVPPTSNPAPHGPQIA